MVRVRRRRYGVLRRESGESTNNEIECANLKSTSRWLRSHSINVHSDLAGFYWPEGLEKDGIDEGMKEGDLGWDRVFFFFFLK